MAQSPEAKSAEKQMTFAEADAVVAHAQANSLCNPMKLMKEYGKVQPGELGKFVANLRSKYDIPECDVSDATFDRVAKLILDKVPAGKQEDFFHHLKGILTKREMFIFEVSIYASSTVKAFSFALDTDGLVADKLYSDAMEFLEWWAKTEHAQVSYYTYDLLDKPQGIFYFIRKQYHLGEVITRVRFRQMLAEIEKLNSEPVLKRLIIAKQPHSPLRTAALDGKYEQKTIDCMINGNLFGFCHDLQNLDEKVKDMLRPLNFACGKWALLKAENIRVEFLQAIEDGKDYDTLTSIRGKWTKLEADVKRCIEDWLPANAVISKGFYDGQCCVTFKANKKPKVYCYQKKKLYRVTCVQDRDLFVWHFFEGAVFVPSRFVCNMELCDQKLLSKKPKKKHLEFFASPYFLDVRVDDPDPFDFDLLRSSF
jgi:hypothetical protein